MKFPVDYDLLDLNMSGWNIDDQDMREIVRRANAYEDLKKGLREAIRFASEYEDLTDGQWLVRNVKLIEDLEKT